VQMGLQTQLEAAHARRHTRELDSPAEALQ
jgi:hypothetical protein